VLGRTCRADEPLVTNANNSGSSAFASINRDSKLRYSAHMSDGHAPSTGNGHVLCPLRPEMLVRNVHQGASIPMLE
jgi:hypothetical protein